MSVDISKIGRFDRSFIVMMIRDFFLLLIVVVLLEQGVRFAIVMYDFNHEHEKETAEIAENIANDVRNLMRNKGGPIVSSTLYPIIKRNHLAIGYQMSLIPSDETISSIKKVFDFTPKGIPAEWGTGRFYEKRVDILAESSCLSCHVDAKLGSTLGQLKVRSYLGHHIESWWAEARLTALLRLGEAFIHSFILFFLLKVRMEPMLSLRAVVASLSKAGADLNRRATLTSEDEFGELARDLNHFLDRLSMILDDVGEVLEKVTVLNLRLKQVNSQIEKKFEQINASSQHTSASMFKGNPSLPILSEEWKTAMQLTISSLKDSVMDPAKMVEINKLLPQIWQQFDNTSKQLEDLNRTHALTSEGLAGMNVELNDFGHYINEMKGLESKMENISVQGQKLIQRLTGKNIDSHES